MNINKIRKMINELVGKNVVLKVNLGRNKEEIYGCIITKTYPSVFCVKVGEFTKSFSYCDVLTKAVIINKI